MVRLSQFESAKLDESGHVRAPLLVSGIDARRRGVEEAFDPRVPGGHEHVRADQHAEHAFGLVALDGFVRGLPHRLDTPIGEDALNLSGGQRRRLALARAFLLKRPILLLDEPLANIDAESANVILEALDRLRTTQTCFAVTHEQSLAARADRLYRLENGQLHEVLGRRRFTRKRA